MKQIVITGLDGSGKSTVLSSLSTLEGQNFDIIYLPHIHPDTLNGSEKLKKIAFFINSLSEQADRDKNHQLKAVSLFASMLVFSDIIDLKEKEGFNTVFCERHPLIDSGIYAIFYAEKMKINTLSPETVNDIEQKYKEELADLHQKIPRELRKDREASIDFFIQFIYNWFHVEKKTAILDLQFLFNTTIPTQIYYLKANPEILFSRISGREVLEAHETIAALTRLSSGYDLLLTKLKNTHPQLVIVINADTTVDLDEFTEFIILNHCR